MLFSAVLRYDQFDDEGLPHNGHLSFALLLLYCLLCQVSFLIIFPSPEVKSAKVNPLSHNIYILRMLKAVDGILGLVLNCSIIHMLLSLK